MSSDVTGCVIRFVIFIILTCIQVVIITYQPNLLVPTVLIGAPLWISFVCYVNDINMQISCIITGIAVIGSFICVKSDVITALVVIHAITIAQMVCIFPIISGARTQHNHVYVRNRRYRHRHKQGKRDEYNRRPHKRKNGTMITRQRCPLLTTKNGNNCISCKK